MTSRQYEYILMIAQEGNLSKAAKRIGVSLSYLSKQIQMIETELGVQILTRNASHAHLNYIGQELEQRARLLLLQERSMKQEMIDSMDQRTGMLSVGIGSYRSTYMLPKILPQFYRKYKETQINLVEAAVEIMEPLVLEGKVDIAITIRPSHNKAILNSFLGTEDLILAVPPNYQIAAHNNKSGKLLSVVSLDQLQDIPFIFLEEGTSLHAMTMRFMEREGFSPSAKLESKSLEAIFNLVLAGVGAAIIPATMVNNDVFMECPKCFAIGDRNFHRNIYAIYRSDSYLSMACKEFLSLFTQSLDYYHQNTK